MRYMIVIIRAKSKDRIYCEREAEARRTCAVMYKFDKKTDRVELWEDNKLIEVWEG